MKKTKMIAEQLEVDEGNEYLTIEYAAGGRNYVHVGYMPELQDNEDVQEFIEYVEAMYDVELYEWDKAPGIIKFEVNA